MDARAAVPALSAYSTARLGPERARLATSLRERLWAAGVAWPAWIDARPGRLGAIVGDCTDLPLGQTRAQLLRQHHQLLVEGLAALGLALCAPRLALSVDEALFAATKAELVRSDYAAIELCRAPAVFPTQPAQALKAGAGVPWVVPAETLAAAGAALSGSTAPRLCSVVGAVYSPQVFAVQSGETPRTLVQRAGGPLVAAWIAICGNQVPGGKILSADEPLPDWTSLLYILPAGHALVRRQRAALRERAPTSCLSCRLCTDFCPQAPHGTAPHRVLHALARQQLKGSDAAAARGCTGCGACSVICPAELLPGTLVAALAQALPPIGAADEPPPPPADSCLPLELVLRRLDLLRYGR